MERRTLLRIALLGGVGWLAGCRSRNVGGDEDPVLSDEDRARAEDALRRGAKWLWSQQVPDGSIPSRTYGFMGLGQSTTPFAVLGLLAIPPSVVAVESERLSLALSWMLRARDPHGALGFAGDAPDYPVYATAMMLACLATVRPKGWEGYIAPSVMWLRSQQLRAGAGWSGESVGGFPMGSPDAPSPGTALHVDISMTRRAVEALRAIGAVAEDPAIVEARAFVERCVAANGAFIYSPAEEMLNKGERKGEVVLGYGSATTDGLLALAACGAERSDPVLQAGLRWLRANHRSDANPGVGSGPYAGYAAAMRFLYRAGAATVFMEFGGPKAWRSGLVDALVTEQREDGSWQNEAALQKENDPILATAFALQTLAAILGGVRT